MPKVLIVDDHEVVLVGLEYLLTDLGYTKIFRASTLSDASKAIKKHDPNLTILDVEFEDKFSIGMLEFAMMVSPKMQVILYTKHTSSSIIHRFMAAGVRGFVNKLSSIDVMRSAIRNVMDGKYFFDEVYTEVLAHKSVAQEKLNRLTTREMEIFLLLIQYLSYSEIAETAGVSIKTIGTYRTRIATKLEVRTREEMREFAAACDIK